jgi:hypothetical protein
MDSAPKPKIKLTGAQLRAIAALTPGVAADRFSTALRPIGREALAHRLQSARQRMLEAGATVDRIALARYANANADPNAPPLPLDAPRYQAACRKHEAAQADYAAAWARIQALIDRAKALLGARHSTPER